MAARGSRDLAPYTGRTPVAASSGLRGALLVFTAILLACSPTREYQPRNGDIVFHTSRSSQSLAIQLATRSPYSHMGIVCMRGAEALVFEAVQPVKLTPLATWIELGEDARFVA